MAAKSILSRLLQLTIVRKNQAKLGLFSATLDTPLASVVSQRLFTAYIPRCPGCHRLSLHQHHAPQPSTMLQHTVPYTTGVIDRKSMYTKMWERLGFSGRLRYKKRQLKISGLRLYLCCVELVEHEDFVKALELPDTFNSWFRITELHIWMIMVRLNMEGPEGKLARNNMIRYMWQDVDQRSRKLGDLASFTARKEGINTLSGQFKGSLYSYDEGILSDDRVLAGAIYRNFFEMSCQDPVKIEKMVQFIRKQVAHLDQQDTHTVLGRGFITFLPLDGSTENTERNKAILKEILVRS